MQIARTLSLKSNLAGLRNCMTSLVLIAMGWVLGFSESAPAQSHKAATAPSAVITAPVQRPTLPDGLYITGFSSGSGRPFLLVEKGEWLDPYTWVQQNGIDALNAQFVQGKSFENFHVNTWHATTASMTLHSLSAQQLLAHDKLRPYAKVNINALPPAIQDRKCSFGEGMDKNRWECRNSTVSAKVRPGLQSCSIGTTSMGCGDGITVPVPVYREIVKTSDPGLLKVDVYTTVRQIEAEFKRLGQSKTVLHGISADVYPLQAFYGPVKQRLTAGYITVRFRIQKNWKPHFSGEQEPTSNIELGFIWDVDQARFAYLQNQPKVLDAGLMRACKRPILSACPHAQPAGMWVVGDKLYAVWQYTQAIGVRTYNNPPSFGVYRYEPKDELGLPKIQQLAVLEVALKEGVSRQVFATQPFLSF